MYEQTLLERIASLESRKDIAEETSAEKEIKSVILHLRKLLNTNRGSVLIADDYGMPDITRFMGGGFLETAGRIEKAIHETVEKYEKRLSDLKIKIESSEEDVLSIHFSLEGVLSRQENVPVFLESFLQPNGRIKVKG
ncbi:putative Type VI secretion system lysozyme-related protein [Desulfamplus magnetovallimortis]|uniref:Putative Type VI secretion system lysozyme-related protein n=1 Tax=Desulfamplus magnetovallimortis TaxID=1246637 RepID=L0R441_9BACT|nr:type VI secretion system baseplate subunit TssE [Desulfamplus magnetovallimortis]CCO06818.1 putative Type VI secretion system lysozyme-related protein [Desulfamplus magnetovallimortis BW-1]SLM32869.1 putative Type VI secretion system lysozyme-related protein [Desulfamplus magnetovallimortis]